MAVTIHHLSWWLWGGKHQDSKIGTGSSTNSSKSDSNMWEFDNLKFPLVHGGNVALKRDKKKWQSRKEPKIDKDYDVVLVPSDDGGCSSGSESDGSDWSIGWLEPLGVGFQSDDNDSEDSFAVLVPCYGCGHNDVNVQKNPKNKFFDTIGNISDVCSSENNVYMEQWLSSLRRS